jgi:hypothetical protein
MAEVIYKGDHAEVLVPITASVSVTCTWGEPCEVPDEVAASLLQSAAWMKAGKKAGKKTAEAVEDNNDDEKGATDGSR